MHPVYHAKITVSTKNFPRHGYPLLLAGIEMVFWGLTEALQTAFSRVFCRACPAGKTVQSTPWGSSLRKPLNRQKNLEVTGTGILFSRFRPYLPLMLSLRSQIPCQTFTL